MVITVLISGTLCQCALTHSNAKEKTAPLDRSYCTVCVVVADRAMSILSAMLAIQACSKISHVSIAACKAIKRELVGLIWKTVGFKAWPA